MGPTENDAFSTVCDRLEFLVMGSQGGDMQTLSEAQQKKLKSFFSKANKAFDKLNITETDGVFNGTPFFSGRDEHLAPDAPNFQWVGENILFPLAFEYRVTKKPEALARAIGLIS